MLDVRDLHVFHGMIEAVRGISFTVPWSQCVVLLGPNGVGKTSTISAIAGVARSTGSIRLEDQPIEAMSAEDRVRSGISVSPEGRRIFANLTVMENLVIGGATVRDKAVVKARIERWLATFPILAERRDQPAGTLSGGEQQMLTIARALMAGPKILLLDEPSLGLAPQICQQIFSLIADLKADGMTILLVEQNAAEAVKLADYVYLLRNGVVVAEGDQTAIGENEALMAELTGIA